MRMDTAPQRRRLLNLDRRIRELEALRSIAMILSTRAGQRVMLLEILDVLERDLGMPRGTAVLLAADGEDMVVQAARAPTAPADGPARCRLGEGVTGKVLRTGSPALIPRISTDPEFRDRIHGRRSLPDGEERSFVCVPIRLGREVVGALSAEVRYEPSASLEEWERILGVVAAMIANDVKARRVNSMQRDMLEAENRHLRMAMGEQVRPENVIGSCRAMRVVYGQIHQAAAGEATVLIRGESGTGKELIAGVLHFAGARADKPFVKVHCAALEGNLLESDIFGHEKGAFVGAMQERAGRVEQADGGTLFLDEIGVLPPPTQEKLIGTLRDGVYQRVGGNRPLRADVRIIAATSCDLEKEVQNGRFRQDLYDRLNGFAIHMPPLRDRGEDILLLANHFVDRYAGKTGKSVRRISTTAINLLMAYHWPGNVRELENCIEHAVLLSSDEVIHGSNLPPTLQAPETNDAPPVGSMKIRVNMLERDMITDAMKRAGGNVSAAARELGITARMVRYKIAKLGIETHRKRHPSRQG